MPEMFFRQWKEVEDGVQAACKALKENNVFVNGVYGPARGGCCLAVMFSHGLGVSYLTKPQDGCLVVDDISDTGSTLHRIKEAYCVKTYTDVWKSTSIVKPDYYGFSVSGGLMLNGWFVFPWELRAQ